MTIEQLYKDYNKKLYIYALNKFGDISLAEDFVQRTFLSCLVHKYDASRGASYFTWLVSLLQYEIRTYYRELADKGIPTPEQFVPLEEVGTELGIYSSAHIEQYVEAALAIKKLPPPLRDIAFKYYVEGWTFEELGEQYHFTRQNMHRIICNIAKRLREPHV